MTDVLRIGPPEERQPPVWQVYWRALKSRRLALAIGGLFGAAAAWSAAAVREPVYEAAATLELRAPNEAFLGLDGVSREAARTAYPQRSELQTNVRLLETGVLIRRTRDALLSAGSGLDAPLREAAATLDVRADDDSRILEVRAQASDPVIAAAFVNQLSENFIAEQTERRWSTTIERSRRGETSLPSSAGDGLSSMRSISRSTTR